jgi:uroporphyrinogen decarboxylase
MTVIQHGIPDRVPVDLHNFLAAIAYVKAPLSVALQDGEILAESQLHYWKVVGHDVLLVENGVIAEAQACGCTIAYSADQPARVVEHILAGELEKVDELGIPDPEKAHPMCEVLKAVRILSRQVGKLVFIMGRADQGPVALAAALRGWEQLIYDMKSNEQPALLHRLLDFCTQVQARYMLALREAGAHGTATGEAGVDIIGPRLYRKFAYPYDCKLISQLGVFPVALHICGDSTLILPEMVNTGAQILELDYKTDMPTAKAALRGKCAFLGPVNPELIWAGTPAEVQAAAKEAIDVLAPGGEFILGPGCALGSDTPIENVIALVDAAEKWGRYSRRDFDNT